MPIGVIPLITGGIALIDGVVATAVREYQNGQKHMRSIWNRSKAVVASSCSCSHIETVKMYESCRIQVGRQLRQMSGDANEMHLWSDSLITDSYGRAQ